ncbi:MAG: radical SAM protein [Clostridia bacterium]|nr:radical SAM protein [Clostridia bacterium]
MTACTLCPRRCGIDRAAGQVGFCGEAAAYRVARIAPHLWEEPPISGERGSGTVFFSGCNFRCIFCQNREISREGRGRTISEDELTDAILGLQEQGVHNINLVTPTHYTAPLASLLEKLKPRLHIPVVWNSGGYESTESLRQLEGLVDVYLPDFKYLSADLAAAYSAAPDYPQRATEALLEMYRQTGAYREEDHLAKRGVLIRHLVLPGCRNDSIAVLRHVAGLLPPSGIRVSVMRQYTPDFAMDCPHKNLRRRVTEFEYTSVLEEADRLGLTGFSQGKDAATKAYTPDFMGD